MRRGQHTTKSHIHGARRHQEIPDFCCGDYHKVESFRTIVRSRMNGRGDARNTQPWHDGQATSAWVRWRGRFLQSNLLTGCLHGLLRKSQFEVQARSRRAFSAWSTAVAPPVHGSTATSGPRLLCFSAIFRAKSPKPAANFCLRTHDSVFAATAADDRVQIVSTGKPHEGTPRPAHG